MTLRRTCKRLSLVLLLLLPTTLLAGDRHVYLDTDQPPDGQLNDCPNPAHNAQGTSNTANLSRCQGGSSSGKIIGSAPGRVSSSACTSGGGTVQPLRSGDSADVDGDDATEPVYGHPQACVYNMAKSDSCEIHSGVYRKVGAFCDEDCAPGVAQTLNACERGDCWQATVVAYGQGPNLGSSGYGTANAPGYLRGADSSGSIDTWDSDGDLIPDTEPGEPTSYPVVFSGDANGNGTFEATTCSGNSCTGDAFFGVIVGCGGQAGYGSAYCSSSMPAGNSYTRIDHDGDGIANFNYGTVSFNSVKSDHFIIKDIEFKGYNGGNGAGGGARTREGMIALEGNNNQTDGLKVEHIYVHSNDYSLTPSSENYWSVFSDSHNYNCSGHTEIKDSYIIQTNEKVVDDDCSPVSACGCPKSFHDNRVLVNITSPRKRVDFAVFAYLKSIDSVNGGTRKKDHRFYNNEFIVQSSQKKFWDIQEFGDDQTSNGPGNGEIWFYGNIVRDRTPGTQTLNRFWPVFCTGTVDNLYRVYFFNNTFDQVYNIGSDGLGVVCDRTAELMVERNNAYYQPRFVHSTLAQSAIRTHEVCSTSSSNPATCTVSTGSRTAWFDPGLPTGLYDSRVQYAPKSTGPLSAAGSCDPDGDGVAGVDYDGDGVNDTSWRDIAGGLVTCSQVSSPIHVGALQAAVSGQPPATPAVGVVFNIGANQATVSGTAFSDPDGDAHAASQFQVAPQASGFGGAGVVDSGVLSGAVTQWTASGLAPGTAYHARLRYRDASGLWSSWSADTASPFTTVVDTTPPAAVQNLRRTDTN